MFDLEHMLLRFPKDVADSLNQDLLDGTKLEKIFKIKFCKESRECVIRYRDKNIKGLILNLPNEACTMKTVNNETFTNILPIKQMILADKVDNSALYNKEFTMKDGVAPPLKGINILKYRKPKKNQSVKMMKMIKEMLLADSKADSVWYKMVDELDDEETEIRDIEYIRTESERLENEKRKAKEAKDHLIAIDYYSSDSNKGNSSNDSSSSSMDNSDISLTDEDDDDEDDIEWSTDDNDFEDY